MDMPNQSSILRQKLAEANDNLEYFERELDTTTDKLKKAEEDLEETKGTLADTEEALQITGRDCDLMELKCKRHYKKVRTVQRKMKTVLKEAKKKQRAVICNITAAHTAEINAVRQEIQESEEQQGDNTSLGMELRTANATVRDLQLQLDMMSSDLRRQRDGISKLNEQLQERDMTITEVTTKEALATSQLSEVRALLIDETTARKQARVEADTTQAQLASIEAMIDAAMDQIGCTEDFANRPKLDYIPESAKVVMMMLEEGRRVTQQLEEERAKGPEQGLVLSGDVSDGGDWVSERSTDLEAQLRAHIEVQTAEIADQAAQIEKQNGDRESQVIEVKNLRLDIQRKVEAMRAWEKKQLAREQARATELEAVKSENVALWTQHTEQLAKIHGYDKLLYRRGVSLKQERRDKENAVAVLAETKKELKITEDLSAYRRSNNLKFMDRIDHDTEAIARHWASELAKDEEIASLTEQVRQNEQRHAKMVALLAAERKTIAAAATTTTVTATTAAKTYTVVAVLLAVVLSAAALVRSARPVPVPEPTIGDCWNICNEEVCVIKWTPQDLDEPIIPPSLTIQEVLPPTRVSGGNSPVPGIGL